MARQVQKLSARQVETIKKPGRHSDGGNLYLSVTAEGNRRWVFLYRWNGGQREMGLGGAAKGGGISLAQARALAQAARDALADGRDPLAEKKLAKKTQREGKTFGRLADEKIAELRKKWRNEKHGAQWVYSLTTLVAPLRSMNVAAITTDDVLKVLRPVWQRTPETGARLRSRIEAVLASATVQGYREGPNPAQWKNHLDQVLSPRKTRDRKNYPAMPYSEVPAFIEKLRARESIAAQALEFTILNAARSGETLDAKWTEIDFDRKLWIVPGERMKSGREHRVPLAPRALAILKELRAASYSDFIFPGTAPQRPLSQKAMAMVLRRMGVAGASPHGFRSTFKTWSMEATSFPPGISEAALAHQIPDKTERSYDRAELLDKRRALMTAWADFVEPGKTSKIISLAKATR